MSEARGTAGRRLNPWKKSPGNRGRGEIAGGIFAQCKNSKKKPKIARPFRVKTLPIPFRQFRLANSASLAISPIPPLSRSGLPSLGASNPNNGGRTQDRRARGVRSWEFRAPSSPGLAPTSSTTLISLEASVLLSRVDSVGQYHRAEALQKNSGVIFGEFPQISDLNSRLKAEIG